ncbi:cathepsin L1-like isoform X2 [Contarinia nasturtii]|nr:cathepsin L1-like isoform X2 [Contarinia nasturtii]
MKGYKRSNQLWEPDDEPKPSENSIYFIEPFNLTLPRSIDWRDIGAVAEIKNQGVCGSCWSFSATGALEGQHFRKTGQLISLSEQNLIDCSSDGCNGGFPDKALQYIKDNGGINTENAYPYKYGDDYFEDKTCKYNATNVGAIVTGVVKIPTGDEQKLMTALATIGPISVAIDASGAFGFYHHSKGVYYNPNCATENENLDHAVLLVGYGTDANGKDYYIIKNSWGTSWGDGGFMKMARTGQNHCGIATDAYYPLV